MFSIKSMRSCTAVLKYTDLADIRLVLLYIWMQFLKLHPSIGTNLRFSGNKFSALVHLRHKYTSFSLQKMIRAISIVTIFSIAPPDIT